MLNFDYDLVQGQRVVSILGAGRSISNRGTVSYDLVAFCLENTTILVSVNFDTDELIVSIATDVCASKPEVVFKEIPELNSYAGEELGWIWQGKNSQGYSDLLALSFSGIDPTCCLVGLASQVELNRISKIQTANG